MKHFMNNKKFLRQLAEEELDDLYEDDLYEDDEDIEDEDIEDEDVEDVEEDIDDEDIDDKDVDSDVDEVPASEDADNKVIVNSVSDELSEEERIIQEALEADMEEEKGVPFFMAGGQASVFAGQRDEGYDEEDADDEVFSDENQDEDDELFEDEDVDDDAFSDDDLDELDELEYDDDDEDMDDNILSAVAMRRAMKHKKQEMPEDDDGERKKGFHIGPVEIGIAIGALLIAALAIFACIRFASLNRNAEDKQTIAMNGSALLGVEAVGMEGIEAVMNAAKDKLAQQLAEQERLEQLQKEEEEKEKTKISATLNYTSIEKDIKLKFINLRTGKLIASTPFEVEFISSAGKKTVYTDDDMDGVIYQSGLKAGKYTVVVKETEQYKFNKDSYEVVIKDTIVYDKVDVTDEIKKEEDVNVSEEDTEEKPEIEEVLKDTVEWVESSKTVIAYADGYKQIDKSLLAEPKVLTATVRGLYDATVYPLTAELGDYVNSVTINPPVSEPIVLEQGGTLQLGCDVQVLGNVPNTVQWTSNSDIITVVDGLITVSNALTITADTLVTVTATADGFSEDGITHPQATLTITVKAPETTEGDGESGNGNEGGSGNESGNGSEGGNGSEDGSGAEGDSGDGEGTEPPVIYANKITLDKEETKIKVGDISFKLLATLFKSDDTVVTSAVKGFITWKSSDETIATVSEEGVVKALKPGKVTITATSTIALKDATPDDTTDDVYPSVDCEIMVTNASLKLELPEKEVIYLGKEIHIPVKVELNGEKTTTDGKEATNGLVTWKSSNAAVATVDPVTGVIKPVSKGTFTLTATSVDKDENDKQVEVSCLITVAEDPKNDTTTLLKTSGGEQVYVFKDGKYVEAASADYYTQTAFYVKAAPIYRYTGWQTIDGKTYYFDKNGNYVTGTQVILGSEYKFNSDGTLNLGDAVLGIDVSSWNRDIDWKKVKNSGVSFVIIRVGFRGSSSGALVEDLYFEKNIKGAIEAGLNVGVYFFSQAITKAEAVEEASMVLDRIKNYKITYPVFIDTEPSGGRADSMSKAQRTEVCKAFCETVKKAGYEAGVYSSKNFFNNKLNASELSSYKIWVAQYASACDYKGKYDMWQFSSTGNISGISGDVDLNYSYMGY